MKCLIFCGGKGTRLGNTEDAPKPLVNIGKYPILCCIMQHFSKYGYDEFVLLAGYKLEAFHDFSRKWFIGQKWNIEVLDTGEDTMTGGRLFRYMNDHPAETFFLTYGDGISNVDLDKLYEAYYQHGNPVTITAVHPPSRFGKLDLGRNNIVQSFSEKPSETGWINGGFMLVDSGGVLPYYQHIQDKDNAVLERDIFPMMAKDGLISAYKHGGFWQCMDTPRDVDYLRELRKDNKQWKKIFG